jgi:Flp pilus assembly protein TadD
LWNAGSREGAMSVLQQVISNLERSPEGGGAGFALPVRELARMQLADARPGAAWELLTRLESQLGNDPESWALRGNAAQRLGRHQDSANAYQAALQLRPNEQRWLLGAAVSLAALGQAAAAGDMTDKARAVGPVAKDVLAYLRQMGVPVKD